MELVYCTICGTVYAKEVIVREQAKYRKDCHGYLVGSGVIRVECGHSYLDLKTARNICGKERAK